MRASDPKGAPKPSAPTTITDTGTAATETVDALAATFASDPGLDTADDLIGQTIDRYQVTARLGSGGMGVVYAAHDPALDRKVALKVLPPLDDEHRAHLETRLRREAQALARLDHDNVIAVYDVGVAERSLFVAMQRVEGPTLGEHLDAERPPPRRILELFVAAARGLAAAHAAGIVHRDFKPSNVLVDRAGRVYVGDFGLARTAGDDDPAAPAPTASLLDERMTRAGAVMGTPIYMSPEQHRGEAATARSDQFSFCVCLWQALFGAHPFVAGRWTPAAAVDAMARDAVREPASTRGVPPRVIRALRRGMRLDPAERWPAMTALIEQLAPRSRAGLLLGGLALAGMAGGVVLTIALTGDRDPAEACRAGADRVAGVWPGRAAEVAAAFADAPIPDAKGTGERVASGLGRYAKQWRSLRIDACDAADVRGDTTRTLRDMQLRCLDDDLRVVDLLITDLAAARPAVLARALDAVSSLPVLDDCAASVQASMAPPEVADLVAISEVRTDIKLARTLSASARHTEARPILEAAVARAEAIGYPPLLAEALLANATVLHHLDDRAAGALASRAAEIATSARSDRVAAEALALGLVIAAEQPDLPRIELLLPLARAAATRTGDAERIATFKNAAGAGAVASADPDTAIRLCQEALDAVTGPDHEGIGEATAIERVAVSCLMSASFAKGDIAKAAEWAERGLAAAETTYGVGTFGTASSLQRLGMARRRQGRLDDAIALSERALALYEQVTGTEGEEAGTVLSSIAQMKHEARKPAEGIPYAERALAIARAKDRPPGKQTVSAETTMAQLLRASGQRAEMRAHYQAALEIAEKVLAPDDGMLSSLRASFGSALAEDGEDARALELLGLAQEALARTGNPRAAVVSVMRAEILMEDGKWAEAVPILEAAHTMLETAKSDAMNLFVTKLSLADCLWQAKIDRKRARALVTEARAAAVARGDSGAELVAECDAWLRSH